MDQSKKEPQRNWKKIALVGAVALITPGGFIALGVYGIKKFLDRRKSKDVPTEGSEKRDVPNT